VSKPLIYLHAPQQRFQCLCGAHCKFAGEEGVMLCTLYFLGTNSRVTNGIGSLHTTADKGGFNVCLEHHTVIVSETL
jgi:hypothetical protein